MKFTVDVGELAVVLERDAEPPGVDLTRDGLLRRWPQRGG